MKLTYPQVNNESKLAALMSNIRTEAQMLSNRVILQWENLFFLLLVLYPGFPSRIQVSVHSVPSLYFSPHVFL